jgi:hypothetical protein
VHETLGLIPSTENNNNSKKIAKRCLQELFAARQSVANWKLQNKHQQYNG